MQVHTITSYNFNELDEKAKAKALDKCREFAMTDYDAEFVIQEAKEIGALMGIDIDKVYYSGFWSQGDGACFEGDYSYKKGSVKAVKDYFPNDTVLHGIAEDLVEAQKRHAYKLNATVKHRGHYSHEYCTDIEVYREGEDYETAAIEDAATDIKDSLRDFMRWIYKGLQASYDYSNSDEAITELVEANEYQFLASGAFFH